MSMKEEGARNKFIMAYIRERDNLQNILKQLDVSRAKFVSMRTFVQDNPDIFSAADWTELNTDLQNLKAEIKAYVDAM